MEERGASEDSLCPTIGEWEWLQANGAVDSEDHGASVEQQLELLQGAEKAAPVPGRPGGGNGSREGQPAV